MTHACRFDGFDAVFGAFFCVECGAWCARGCLTCRQDPERPARAPGYGPRAWLPLEREPDVSGPAAAAS